jgi:type II secretory ATPase GspE/PulE/Tfp pilus assembly ATPase PilB-like protein
MINKFIEIDATEERVAVRIVDALLSHALFARASDIHCESQEHRMRIRYRIDGILIEQEPIDGLVIAQVVARIKILAGMNTMQRRIPQDGKFVVNTHNGTVDIRVATYPSTHGEAVVLRLLDRSAQILLSSQLGLSNAMHEDLLKLMQYTYGLFLVTGPTGSGKTTTLYALLQAINDNTKNIVTLEDPVEYSISGITQGQVDVDAGFTFDKGVRAMLRQDPDIMLIGEIRDKETAQVAIEAALTGHVVLSTLHTNDAPSALIRLIEMGIEPFLLKSAVVGILAQRLIRKVCKECVQHRALTEDEISIFEQYEIVAPSTVAQACGCDRCTQTGYYGRLGIFELLTASDALRSLLHADLDILRIQIQAAADGLKPLGYDALLKVADGVTTMQEVASLLT